MTQSTSPSPSFTPPPIEEVAKLLPAYDVIDLIAQGGMGVVYHARQKSLDREVAIKILPRSLSSDENFRISFENEARNMAKLNHPNLIGIYDFGHVDGMLYIIMEMVKGKSLFHSSNGQMIDPQQSIEITLAICKGLAHAHAHGILHRDIKPANILLDPSIQPKIGDFGLAHPLEDGEDSVVFGTPGYTAPEVIDNPSLVDKGTDIYALGVLFYELLCGKLPQNPYQKVKDLVPSSPKGIDHVILKAIHPTAKLRYSRVEDFASDLKKLLTPTNLSPLPPQHPNIPSPSPYPSSTDKRLLTGLFKFGIIVFLLGAIYFTWQLYKTKKNNLAKASIIQEQKIADYKKKQAQKKKNAQSTSPLDRPDKPSITLHPPQQETASPHRAFSRTPQAGAPQDFARLKKDLNKGLRGEFPRGTVIGEKVARYFFPKNCDWQTALKTARLYGGSLVMPRTQKELHFLINNLPEGASIWLGAGKSLDQWVWLDGSPLTYHLPPPLKNHALTLSANGILASKEKDSQQFFLIEWQLDGRFPDTLKNQLATCNHLLNQDKLVFPVGTFKDAHKYYLFAHKKTTWKKAFQLAKSAGGTLFCPKDEASYHKVLAWASQHIPAHFACWVGGFAQANKACQWIDDSPWNEKLYGIPPVKTTPLACALLDSNLKYFHATDKVSYFLIEWDISSINLSEPSPLPQEAQSTLNQINALAYKEINAISSKYQTRYKKNLEILANETEQFSRSFSNEQRNTFHLSLASPKIDNDDILIGSMRVCAYSAPIAYNKKKQAIQVDTLHASFYYYKKTLTTSHREKLDRILASRIRFHKQIAQEKKHKLNTLFKQYQSALDKKINAFDQAGKKNIAHALREEQKSLSTLDDFLQKNSISP